MISHRARPRRRAAAGRTVIALAAIALTRLAALPTVVAFHDATVGGPLDDVLPAGGAGTSHVVISEVMTGGAGASDEFIEIYNPTSQALPLEGLEVVYVTASGSTITRKASWPAGSAGLPAGAHVLVVNSAGVYDASGDQTYTGGLASTGGSVAIRILGAATAVDAVGWGNAASTWLEGMPAAAVAAGHSIERLPGGAAGSDQDTDANSADFIDQALPDPQNSLSTPIPVPTPSATPTSAGSGTATPTAIPSTTISAVPSPTVTPSSTPTAEPPSATPSATPVATPSPTPVLSPTPTPTPSATPAPVLSIAQARALADGSVATIEGLALTDSNFADGGGYVVDETAGIAVLLSDGAFERGARLRITGMLDDRFSQRTLRADSSGVAVLGTAQDPGAQERTTGTVAEADEGELVAISGTLTSNATQLTSAVAFDVDDGSGPIRVLVGNGSGIDLGAWTRGSLLQVRGVIGQRDSSGTGTGGYRLQPRDAQDVLAIAAPTPSPTPSTTPTPSPTASPSPSANPNVIGIAAARAKPFNTRVTVRGVVTLPSGLAEEGTAAIQDATGAIVLRLGDEAGTLHLGELVEVAGTRSTKAGMETLRVVAAPRRFGTQAQPDPRRRATGAVGEADEAVLISITGGVSTTPRRTSADNVYFDVDDGSGPVRVFVTPGADVDTEHLLSGTQVEIVGVLGQETTGRLPDRGYRLWPRRAGDLRIVAQPPGAAGGSDGGTSTGHPHSSPGGGSGAGLPGAPASGSGGRVDLPQQARPRLLLGAAGSAAPAAAGPPGAEEPVSPNESSAPPVAAGLLLLGGLLLTGSAAATGDPQLLGRLLKWLRARLSARSGPDLADEGASADGERASAGLPRLVPMPVAEESDPALPRAARSIHEERERILPPT